MATKSAQEIFEDFKNEVQSQDETLSDWNEGSLLDIIAGATAQAVAENNRTTMDEFRKTWTKTANGPEITGGTDELQNLYVDHFGEEFERPAATEAEGVVAFSRPTSTAGDCTILAGTIVKTAVNAAGVAQRFATEATVVLTGLTINASVKAVIAGTDGNVEDGEINEIETTLTDDTVTVTNADALSGGTNVATDAEYREFAANLFLSLRGATLAALEAKAKTVAGVEFVKGRETVQTVIEWNEAGGTPIGDAFKISRNKLYIADANGEANAALLENVDDALEFIRACGVRVETIGAVAISQNVSVSLILDAGGPHFAELSVDAQPILDDIEEYLQDLAIGDDLIRALLKDHIMDIWGPTGSADLTDITIITPTGDVSVDEDEKMIPGTISKV